MSDQDEEFDPIELIAHQYRMVTDDSELALKRGTTLVLYHAGKLARAYLSLKNKMALAKRSNS